MPPLPTAERLGALWKDIKGALTSDPAAARAALAERLTPVILTPRERKDGSTIVLRTELKIDAAAPEGRPREVRSKVSCGRI